MSSPSLGHLLSSLRSSSLLASYHLSFHRRHRHHRHRRRHHRHRHHHRRLSWWHPPFFLPSFPPSRASRPPS